MNAARGLGCIVRPPVGALGNEALRRFFVVSLLEQCYRSKKLRIFLLLSLEHMLQLTSNSCVCTMKMQHNIVRKPKCKNHLNQDHIHRCLRIIEIYVEDFLQVIIQIPRSRSFIKIKYYYKILTSFKALFFILTSFKALFFTIYAFHFIIFIISRTDRE